MMVVAIVTSLLLTGIHLYQAYSRVSRVKGLKRKYGETFPVGNSSLQEIEYSPFISTGINVTLSYLMLLSLLVAGDDSAVTQFWHMQLLLHLPIPVPFLVSSFAQVYFFFTGTPWKLQADTIISVKEVLHWQRIVKEYGDASFEDDHRFIFGSCLDDAKIVEERYISDILYAKELLVKQHLAEDEVDNTKKFMDIEIEEEVALLNALNEELISLFDSLLYAIGKKDCPVYLEEGREKMMKEKLNKELPAEKRISVAEEQLLELLEDTNTAPELKGLATNVLGEIKSRKKQEQDLSKRELDMATIKTVMLFEGITEEDLQKHS